MIFHPLQMDLREGINLNFHTGSGWVAWFIRLANDWDYNIWRGEKNTFRDTLDEIEDFIISEFGRQSMITKDVLKKKMTEHFKDNKEITAFINIVFKRAAYDEKITNRQQEIEANRADNPAKEHIPTPVNINQV